MPLSTSPKTTLDPLKRLDVHQKDAKADQQNQKQQQKSVDKLDKIITQNKALSTLANAQRAVKNKIAQKIGIIELNEKVIQTDLFDAQEKAEERTDKETSEAAASLDIGALNARMDDATSNGTFIKKGPKAAFAAKAKTEEKASKKSTSVKAKKAEQSRRVAEDELQEKIIDKVEQVNSQEVKDKLETYYEEDSPGKGKSKRSFKKAEDGFSVRRSSSDSSSNKRVIPKQIPINAKAPPTVVASNPQSTASAIGPNARKVGVGKQQTKQVASNQSVTAQQPSKVLKTKQNYVKSDGFTFKKLPTANKNIAAKQKQQQEQQRALETVFWINQMIMIEYEKVRKQCRSLFIVVLARNRFAELLEGDLIIASYLAGSNVMEEIPSHLQFPNIDPLKKAVDNMQHEINEPIDEQKNAFSEY